MSGSAVREALALLEVDDLLLGIPDRSFPSAPDEDTGIGTTGSSAAGSFLGFVRALGFTGVQLGPQGETTAGNASPYDASLFARSRLGVSLPRLVDRDAWEGLLDAASVARLVAARPAAPPDRIGYAYAWQAHGAALEAAFRAFRARRAAGTAPGLAERLAEFSRREAWWLEADARFEALRLMHGDTPWNEWPPADRTPDAAPWSPSVPQREAMERFAFIQLVAHAEHEAFRRRAHALGLAVWGDMQIGGSVADAWRDQGLRLAGYALGAPPSRTNLEGQAWGYPVLDPAQATTVARHLAARAQKMFAEYDGVRVDHPQGLVCPWVYRTDGDALASVQRGARLHESPALADHPALARFAITRADQLNPDPRTPRYADDWVTELDAAQVERYAARLDVLVTAARASGKTPAAIACEALSTCPYPLRRVLEHFGLGRFRVTQKVDLGDPADVYRSEHAAAADWVMVGTHDTRPIWLVADDWQRAGTLPARARYLASRLEPDPRRRASLASALAASPAQLVQAQFADLLACRARHVLVFFADAFGIRDLYNRPGTVSAENWVLRLPADHRPRLRERLAQDGALNLPMTLAMALRARAAGSTAAALAAALEREAAAWRAGDLPAG